MRLSLYRLSILALICCLPLAIAGMMRMTIDKRTAIVFFKISVYFFMAFLCLLAVYTYGKGGHFIKPMGTFY
jgi:TRAP-type mannitol/chloroaromatic compound transport system permease small subunit